MGNLAGHALEANIGGVDALEANIGGVDALEANIGGVSMLRGADGITPTIGENGNWYLGENDTGKPSRGETGPQGDPGIYYGTTQPAGDTHPVWIDPDGDHDDGGLLPAVTAADNGKVLRVVSSAWAADDMPTGGTDMGITGAEVGQIAKITAVDESGVPTAWSPVDMPDKLPNPNALTFTGAVTGSYDGSAPLSVEIPSGGGGGSGNFELIGTVDFSQEGMAAANAGVDFEVSDVSEIVLVYNDLVNSTSTKSFVNVYLNKSSGQIETSLRPDSGKSGTPSNGWVFIKHLPGLGLTGIQSSSAISATNYSLGNARTPYNMIPLASDFIITEISIKNPPTQYYAVGGTVKVYVR